MERGHEKKAWKQIKLVQSRTGKSIEKDVWLPGAGRRGHWGTIFLTEWDVF